MKRRIRQNVYGNWHGYVGRKWAVEFGTEKAGAFYWLRYGIREFDDRENPLNHFRFLTALDDIREGEGKHRICSISE